MTKKALDTNELKILLASETFIVIGDVYLALFTMRSL